jgi:hypothetical protein
MLSAVSMYLMWCKLYFSFLWARKEGKRKRAVRRE